MSTIALIGFRGSGKSTLGRWLAGELEMPFVDTDALVLEHLGFDSVTAAWDAIGEVGWRVAEEQLIPSLLTKHAVIALGGGAPLLKKISEALGDVSMVLHLTASQDVTMERIEEDNDRPALAASDLEIREQRLPMYHQLCSHTIETSGNIDDAKAALLQFTRRNLR